METTRTTWKNGLFVNLINVTTIGLFFLVSGSGSQALAAMPSTQTVRVWLQTMDSCQQAVPGASFILDGNNANLQKGLGGTKPRTVAQAHGKCPLQQGNCVTLTVGCVSWLIPIPSSGIRTHTITETQTPSGYAQCLGGSDCPHGPNTITVNIDPAGHVSITVINTYPNGLVVRFPTNRAPFAGTQADPAIVHNSRIGNGNCDGDNDADDHTTGSEGGKPTCDSDGNR